MFKILLITVFFGLVYSIEIEEKIPIDNEVWELENNDLSKNFTI